MTVTTFTTFVFTADCWTPVAFWVRFIDAMCDAVDRDGDWFVRDDATGRHVAFSATPFGGVIAS